VLYSRKKLVVTPNRLKENINIIHDCRKGPNKTRSKLKWAFPFCEKYDQIWAASEMFFIIQAYEEVQKL
jgi:hypothetical protein